MAWETSDRRAGLPSDWSTRRRCALQRDGYRCQLGLRGCTEKATDVDHIRRGNDHADDNLQSVCRHCHNQKTAAESAARKRQLREARYRPRERHPGQR